MAVEGVNGHPLSRRGHSAVYHPSSNTLIVFGGIYGYSKYLNELLIIKYDLKVGILTLYLPLQKRIMSCTIQKYSQNDEMRVIPDPRAWHSASIIGDSMYVYGGLKRHSIHTNELLSYNIKSSRWEVYNVKGEYAARACHSTFQRDNKIYVLGGHSKQRAKAGILDMLDDSISQTRINQVQVSDPFHFLPLDTMLVIEVLETEAQVKSLRLIQTQATLSEELSTSRTRQISLRGADLWDNSRSVFDWNFSTFPDIQMTRNSLKMSPRSIKRSAELFNKRVINPKSSNMAFNLNDKTNKNEESNNLLLPVPEKGEEDPFHFLQETE